MGESSGSSNQIALAIEIEPNLASYSPPSSFNPIGNCVEQDFCVISVEESIKKSKSHWSQLGDFDSNNEVAEVSNMELFKTLKVNPTFGGFLFTFGEGEGSLGELVMGEKFAEGGQAEIYAVQVKWFDPRNIENALRNSFEYVLKVFKKGTFLRHLQSQWPQGMLHLRAESQKCWELHLPARVRFHCDVIGGLLLEDGRFAFLLTKEEDLRNVINHRMLTRSNNVGPFSNKEALKAMYEIAFGMNQLHDRDIVHRDIKASNVLVDNMICYVADFECSVGVVGTRFWRAPELLEACKHRNVSMKPELFTKAVDIYSYGMTCYEILTGKLPFEGHLWNDSDHVLQGRRPEVPNYVDGWIRKLLNRCWKSNPGARPSSQEILKIF